MSKLIKPAIGLFSLLTVLTGIIYPLAVTGIARWRQLRHKLEEEPARPRFLLTEVGVGYRLAAE